MPERMSAPMAWAAGTPGLLDRGSFGACRLDTVTEVNVSVVSDEQLPETANANALIYQQFSANASANVVIYQ